MQDALTNVQNSDAVIRGDIGNITKKNKAIRDEIKQNELTYKNMIHNEKKDKGYIESLMYELDHWKMNLGETRKTLKKKSEPKNLEDHLHQLKETNIKKENEIMSSILQYEKDIIQKYETVLKIMSDKQYSQKHLLNLMKSTIRPGGEREVAKTKILNILNLHAEVLDNKTDISA